MELTGHQEAILLLSEQISRLSDELEPHRSALRKATEEHQRLSQRVRRAEERLDYLRDSLAVLRRENA